MKINNRWPFILVYLPMNRFSVTILFTLCFFYSPDALKTICKRQERKYEYIFSTFLTRYLEYYENKINIVYFLMVLFIPVLLL